MEQQYNQKHYDINQMMQKYCKEYDIESQQNIINYPQYQKYENCDTFAVYLEINGISVPKEFQYDPDYILLDTMTTAMKISQKGIIPSKHWYHKPEIQDNNGWTVAMQLAQQGIIPPKEWEHKPNLQDKYGNTVAMWLINSKIIPPQQWYHNPYIADEDERTVQDYLKDNNIEVPEQWKVIDKNIEISDEIQQKLDEYCKFSIKNQQTIINYPQYQKHNRYTFAVSLQIKNIEVPKDFLYDPEHILIDSTTSAMKIAEYGKIPSKYWEHNPHIQDNYGFTVQDYLQINNIEVPKQWKTYDYDIKNKNILKYLINYCFNHNINKNKIINNPNYYKNKNKETFAICLAQYGIIPPKQFIHDPNIRTYNNQTVRQYLQNGHLPIPNEWYDNEYKKEHEYNPEYLNNVLNGIITNRPDNIKPETQYDGQWTIAMLYAYQGIIPPECWNHDPLLVNNEKDTVAMLLANNNMLIPKQWQHNPELQNNWGRTIAMIYMVKKQIIPIEWYHKPELQDDWGYTIAMILAEQCIIPPKQWEHNPYMANKFEKTVQDYLIRNNIEIPNQWKVINKKIEINDQIKKYLQKYCKEYDIYNQQIIINYPEYQKEIGDKTFAIYLAYNGILPPKEFEHKSNVSNLHGFTVALCLAWNKIIPPQQWQLNSNIVYKYEDDNIQGILVERTIAHILAEGKIIPPPEWQHNPLLKDNLGNTVGILLSYNGIIPPKEWTHDINITNNQNQSIKSNLLLYGYIYNNNEFIKLNLNNIKQYVQTKILDDTCQICLNESQQEFIISACSHKVCLECFKEMININKQKLFCPICRKEQWFQLINQDQ